MSSETNGGQEITQGAQDASQQQGQGRQETQQQGQQEVTGSTTSDYEKQIAERDARIAEVEDQVLEAAKNAETAEELLGEIAELKAQGESDRVDFKLQIAGVRNVKAARALLADHGGDVDKLKEADARMLAERAGSGMGTIESGWAAGGYPAPTYEVAYGPDRTTLTLPLVSTIDSTGEAQSKAIENNRRPSKTSEENLVEAEMAIVDFLRTAGPARTSEIAANIGKSPARTNVLLRRLTELGFRYRERCDERQALPAGRIIQPSPCPKYFSRHTPFSCISQSASAPM